MYEGIDTQKEDGHVRTDTEIEFLMPAGKKYLVLAEAEGIKEGSFLLHAPLPTRKLSESAWPCQYLDLGLLASKTVTEFLLFEIIHSGVMAVLGN